MTPVEAADLAARTLAATASRDCPKPCDPTTCRLAADRERVASDLAGLRDHDCTHLRLCGTCPDAARYADGLRRTAALYGVTP